MTLMLNTENERLLYDFKTDSQKDWYVMDDREMGGVSYGYFDVNKQAHGHYHGNVSTANNGGFSSIRCQMVGTDVGDRKYIILKVKGDKKSYQIRLKKRKSNYHSYIQTFETNGKWQEIKIPLNELYPSFRGRKLNMEDFNAPKIEEIALLIGNKKSEKFDLLLDWIKLI